MLVCSGCLPFPRFDRHFGLENVTLVMSLHLWEVGEDVLEAAQGAFAAVLIA